MADQDTDRWVFEVLAPDLRRKMKNLKNEIQWTDLVYVSSLTHTHTNEPLQCQKSAQSLREAHSRGITREQIEHSLRIMPFVSSIPSFIPSLNPPMDFQKNSTQL